MSNAFDPGAKDCADDFAVPPADDTKAEVPLIPDREMLLQFAALMFKNADRTDLFRCARSAITTGGTRSRS